METKKESPVLATVLLLAVASFFAVNSDWSGNRPASISEPGDRQNAAVQPIDNIPVAYEHGEKIFKQNCAVCHSMGSNKITGPGLKDVMNRVPGREWLTKWIRNNVALTASGDAYAVKMSASEASQMTVFNNLSDEDINEVIKYVTGN